MSRRTPPRHRPSIQSFASLITSLPRGPRREWVNTTPPHPGCARDWRPASLPDIAGWAAGQASSVHEAFQRNTSARRPGRLCRAVAVAPLEANDAPAGLLIRNAVGLCRVAHHRGPTFSRHCHDRTVDPGMHVEMSEHRRSRRRGARTPRRGATSVARPYSTLSRGGDGCKRARRTTRPCLSNDRRAGATATREANSDRRAAQRRLARLREVDQQGGVSRCPEAYYPDAAIRADDAPGAAPHGGFARSSSCAMPRSPRRNIAALGDQKHPHP